MINFEIEYTIQEYFTEFYLLGDFISKKRNEIVLNSILIQILFSLELLRNFNLMHYDLHTSNIGVIKTTEEYLYYKVKNHIFKVETYGYLIKIFDWDRGYSPDIEEKNRKIGNRNCSEHGRCNELNFQWDFLHIYIKLWRRLKKIGDEKIVEKFLGLNDWELEIFSEWWDNLGKCIVTNKLCIHSDVVINKDKIFHIKSKHNIKNNINNKTIINDIIKKFNLDDVLLRIYNSNYLTESVIKKEIKNKK